MPVDEAAMNSGREAYASFWEKSRGRLHPEPPASARTPYQRDRDRIIHSTAFRRLGHKTQVFISPEGDHIRTRLTHSLEVAQIARAMARALGVDEDLTEAIALAHDLGHTPFGHAGEAALDALMSGHGGFDHNDQTLRLLVLLEQRYPAFNGLNLTWETLEGVVKHNGPMADPPPMARELDRRWSLDLAHHAGLEAQVAAIADDIAYNHHDMDDGLRSGLFTPDAVCAAVPHVGESFAAVDRECPDCGDAARIAETVRRLIGSMVADVLTETRKRLVDAGVTNADAVRRAGRPMVAFSSAMAEQEKNLKAFLFAHMYRADAVADERQQGEQIIADLCRHFMADPDALPADWRKPGAADQTRLVADYIAGMSDRFAERLHRKMLSAAPPQS